MFTFPSFRFFWLLDAHMVPLVSTYFSMPTPLCLLGPQTHDQTHGLLQTHQTQTKRKPPFAFAPSQVKSARMGYGLRFTVYGDLISTRTVHHLRYPQPPFPNKGGPGTPGTFPAPCTGRWRQMTHFELLRLELLTLPREPGTNEKLLRYVGGLMLLCYPGYPHLAPCSCKERWDARVEDPSVVRATTRFPYEYVNVDIPEPVGLSWAESLRGQSHVA